MQSIHITLATDPSDLSFVQSIALSTATAHLFPDLADLLAETNEDILSLTSSRTLNHRNGRFITLIATSPSGIVGFATCKITQDSQSSVSRTINSVYVIPEWRRRGVGTALLSGVERRTGQPSGINSNLYVLGMMEDEGVRNWLGQAGFEEVIPFRRGKKGEVVNRWLK